MLLHDLWPNLIGNNGRHVAVLLGHYYLCTILFPTSLSERSWAIDVQTCLNGRESPKNKLCTISIQPQLFSPFFICPTLEGRFQKPLTTTPSHNDLHSFMFEVILFITKAWQRSLPQTPDTQVYWEGHPGERETRYWLPRNTQQRLSRNSLLDHYFLIIIITYWYFSRGK